MVQVIVQFTTILCLTMITVYFERKIGSALSFDYCKDELCLVNTYNIYIYCLLYATAQGKIKTHFK